ncbi:DUF3616 domain-containing protein [Bosea sp. 124]|uniref:DUF3616 domain-containing protein n=1 Tax=Bosea sp. 124 TaxID=2135642 RepID=UPI000D3A49DA|nr:DUF3616 domain-containing protein [Bosea sp. 124]PTM38579.1 uncharacterized protein DUF3616 [Bosea sp. 124]
METILSRLRLALLMIGLPLLPPAGNAAAAEPPAIRPSAGPLPAGAGFAFERRTEDTRQSLSGVACPAIAAAPRLCLAVFDEGGEARYLTIDDAAIRPNPKRVVLRPGKVELDGEAAATDGKFYYIAGSHSAKRGDCEANPQSRHLIRFMIDPATGRGKEDATGKLAGFADTGALWTLMAGLPGLKDHVGDGMCLGTEPPKKKPELRGRRGVNIEGLAIRDGRLFIGFRGPASNGTAKILSIDAEALFAGGDAAPKLGTIAVGQGRAVRDLLAVSDGILVLAGPDDDDKNENRGWVVLRWDGKDAGDATVQPTPLAALDLSGVPLRNCSETIKRKDIKPEALAVLDDKPDQPYQAVIFSDGLCDGGALRFSIPR